MTVMDVEVLWWRRDEGIDRRIEEERENRRNRIELKS